jgi:hypothetical protein
MARALAFSLIAWGALLGAVFGGGVGVVNHTMADKLAAQSLYLQRQAGTSSATRSARRDQAQVGARAQLAAELPAAAGDDPSADVAAQGFALGATRWRAGAPASAAPEPRLKPRYRAPPSRAPPALA